MQTHRTHVVTVNDVRYTLTVDDFPWHAPGTLRWMVQRYVPEYDTESMIASGYGPHLTKDGAVDTAMARAIAALGEWLLLITRNTDRIV